MLRLSLSGMRRKLCRLSLSEYLRLAGDSQDAVEEWELPVLSARLMEWLPTGEKQVLVAIIEEKMKRL
jgi:hypothetical protein